MRAARRYQTMQNYFLVEREVAVVGGDQRSVEPRLRKVFQKRNGGNFILHDRPPVRALRVGLAPPLADQ